MTALVHEDLGRQGCDDGQVPALVTHIAQYGLAGTDGYLGNSDAD